MRTYDPTPSGLRFRQVTTGVLALMLMAGAERALADDCKTAAPKVEHTAKTRTADFMKKRWNKVDTNRDGVISKDEYLKEATDRFNATDINHDGKITPEEVSQFFENMAQPKKPDAKPEAKAKP
jgi:Ca2+-binding EF-hand superfamily protein